MKNPTHEGATAEATTPPAPSTVTPGQIFDRMPDLFAREPQRLTNVVGVYQFHITGDTGGAWNVSIEDNKATIRQGEAAEPDCAVTIEDRDFVNMAEKRISGGNLFMRGRLRVVGRQDLAMRAPRVFG